MQQRGNPPPETSEAQLAGELLDIIEALLTQLRPGVAIRSITLDSPFERQLGLDSLARMELITRIERHYSLSLPDQVFAEAETPRDLLKELVKADAGGETPRQVHSRRERTQHLSVNPEDAETLVEMLEWHVRHHPQREHIQFYEDSHDGPSLTFQDLYDGATRVAAGLQERGLLPGEAVTIMLPTGAEYFFSFFGILLAGGIPVPVYPPARPTQLEDHMRRHTRILANCRAVIMITVLDAKQVARILKSRVDCLQQIVTVEELQQDQAGLSRVAAKGTDTAFIQYTSGSTGTPKGVVLSHANLLANIRSMGERVKADTNDVFVSWLPLYHDMGLIGAWLGSLYYGALLVVMPPLAFLARPQRWLRAIDHYHGTLSAAPNFAYEMCNRRLRGADLEGLDLSSWRAAFNGAEAVIPGTITEFINKFTPCGFREDAMMPVYGLAENSVGLAFPPPGRLPRIDRIDRETFLTTGRARPASDEDHNALEFVDCGQVISRHELRITDASNEELPDRHQGRIQFCGPSATSGYLHNPEANEKMFYGKWLDSGDLGYISEGSLFVTGRSKDLIIRGGRNLYPHELEEAVGEIAEIRKGRVVAFGSSDPGDATEKLVVIAETRKKTPEAQATLREQINSIAGDLVGGPADEVVFVRPNTILKTSSGKVRRSACRKLYESGHLEQGKVPLWKQVTRLMIGSIPAQFRRFRHGLATTLWRWYAKACFWILTPLTWLLVLVLPVLLWRWKLVQVAGRTLFALTGCPVRVSGRENLPEQNESCIYVSNHASYVDGILVTGALKWPASFIAKEALEHQFFAGNFLRRLETQFVDRFDARKGVSVVQQLASTTGDGRSLVFFPEGTFTRSPGLLPFHLGAFLIAAETNLPVVPMAIRGSRSILRGDSHTPGRGAMAVTIGEPIRLPETDDDGDPWARAIELRDAARAFILANCGEPDLGGEHRPADVTGNNPA